MIRNFFNGRGPLVFLLCLVGVQFFCLVTQRDWFPLTNYPMFPGIKPADDVMIFRVTAERIDAPSVILSHSGWPSMPNYSDFFEQKNHARMRDQVLADYERAVRLGELPQGSAQVLILERLGQTLGDKSLRLRDGYRMRVNPSDRSFSLAGD